MDDLRQGAGVKISWREAAKIKDSHHEYTGNNAGHSFHIFMEILQGDLLNNQY